MTPNFANRTIWTGDNLDVMRGMNSDSVDLIYLDPPFNSGKQWSAPIGSEAAGAAFKDTWSLSDVNLVEHGAIKEKNAALGSVIDAAGLAHGKPMQSYLIYMGIRMLEMQRLLKPTASIYLHCDPTASAWLRTAMDAVFGKDCFRNEIVWSYEKWTNSTRAFQKNHDVILFYAHKDSTFNKLYGPLTDRQRQLIQRGYNDGSRAGKQIVRIYNRDADAVKARLAQWEREGRAIYDVQPPQGKAISAVWPLSLLNGASKERTGYPTQKPLTLLERIVAASSTPGDMVLDPFCGCATACVAAEKLDRQWVGIDVSALAYNLVQQRLAREVNVGSRETPRLTGWDVTHRDDVPQRTDLGDIPPYNSQENRERLYGRQGGYCNGCEHHFPPRNLTIDHIVPRSRGGSHHVDNLQLLCGACNSAKGAGTQEALIAKLVETGVRG